MFILASGSPRRKELLGKLGYDFIVKPVDIDEIRADKEAPAAFAARMAREKAFAAAKIFGANNVYLSADTIVVLGDVVLGKPKNKDDARQMLRSLSNRTHEVVTAVCLLRKSAPELFAEFHEITRVTFKPLSDFEIESYLSTPEPYDKAGAYAAQDVGAFLIQSVEGSYTNVIGLPLSQTVEALRKYGVAETGFGKKERG